MTDLDVKHALEVLTRAGGPSGYERDVARLGEELLRPLVDEIWMDRMGNLVGVKRCGRENARRLLLDAHLDEVGLMVLGLEEGFVRFRAIGGVDPRTLPDREVTLLTDPPIFGVVACLPPHVQGAGDSDKALKVEDLCIDVGLSQEEAEKRIPIGTPMVYRQEPFALGESRFCAKSMDDRACFAALVRCAELLKDEKLDVDVYFLGSCREEVGGYGAQTAAYTICPDWCVAVDVTHGETPDVRHPKDWTCKLGGGPAIGLSPVIPRWMTEKLVRLAGEEDIPYQMEIMTGLTGTNGDEFQIAREGVATAVVSLPERYMHTPAEVIDLEDLEHTARLLAAFARSMGEEGQVC